MAYHVGIVYSLKKDGVVYYKNLNFVYKNIWSISKIFIQQQIIKQEPLVLLLLFPPIFMGYCLLFGELYPLTHHPICKP